jgi:hypothetical protein
MPTPLQYWLELRDNTCTDITHSPMVACHKLECPECVRGEFREALATARREERERILDFIKRMEVAAGSVAEGADEPEFSLHIHAEATLHRLSEAIRALGEGEDGR